MKPPLQTNKSQEYFYQKLLKSVKICQLLTEVFLPRFLWPTVYLHQETYIYTDTCIADTCANSVL